MLRLPTFIRQQWIGMASGLLLGVLGAGVVAALAWPDSQPREMRSRYDLRRTNPFVLFDRQAGEIFQFDPYRRLWRRIPPPNDGLPVKDW